MKLNLKLKNNMEFNIEFDNIKDLIMFVENFTREREREMVSLDNLLAAFKGTALACAAAKSIKDRCEDEEDEDDDDSYEGENYDFYNDFDYLDQGDDDN